MLGNTGAKLFLSRPLFKALPLSSTPMTQVAIRNFYYPDAHTPHLQQEVSISLTYEIDFNFVCSLMCWQEES